MKKIATKISMALVAMMVSAPVLAATRTATQGNSFCELLKQLHGVFNTFRILAFLGAAFVIANWAWGYIKDGDKFSMDDLRKKGTGMLVGFVLLFAIGVGLSFLMSQTGSNLAGCEIDVLRNW